MKIDTTQLCETCDKVDKYPQKPNILTILHRRLYIRGVAIYVGCEGLRLSKLILSQDAILSALMEIEYINEFYEFQNKEILDLEK